MGMLIARFSSDERARACAKMVAGVAAAAKRRAKVASAGYASAASDSNDAPNEELAAATSLAGDTEGTSAPSVTSGVAHSKSAASETAVGDAGNSGTGSG